MEYSLWHPFSLKQQRKSRIMLTYSSELSKTLASIKSFWDGCQKAKYFLDPNNRNCKNVLYRVSLTLWPKLALTQSTLLMSPKSLTNTPKRLWCFKILRNSSGMWNRFQRLAASSKAWCQAGIFKLLILSAVLLIIRFKWSSQTTFTPQSHLSSLTS